MQASRLRAAAAVRACAVSAGTIASRNGSASVAPTPLSTARRDKWSLWTNIQSPLQLSAPHPERRAGHDTPDERREAIAVARGVTHDGAYRRHVGGLEAAAERIRHQLLAHRSHQH